MKNSKVLYHELMNRITLKDSPGEVSEIISRVLERAYGLTRADILTGREIVRSEVTDRFIESCIVRLNREEPLQYILREAYFYGRKFYVDESVLIPRPETEELVRLVITESRKLAGSKRILDIGTGSGCIAISVSLEVRDAEVFATDVSDAALMIARKNQKQAVARVQFLAHDILHEHITQHDLNIIVSNPPYIAMSERQYMSNNVHQYEPGLALFVPDDDPLLYYRALASKSMDALVEGGVLVVEINERFGKETAALFSETGFDQVRVIQDIFRKDRMVIGRRKPGKL